MGASIMCTWQPPTMCSLWDWAKEHPIATSALLGATVLGGAGLVARKKLRDGGMIRDAAVGPLEGVVVLDFSVVAAGPMAASLLAELGAEVIKVDNLKVPDSARGLGNAPVRGMASIFTQVGRGKQSIVIDSRTKQGLEVIQKLVEKADVVIQNFRPGGADRAGIGYEKCKEWNKDIIYCSSSGFGDDGPYADKRIYDMIIQVLSGWTVVQGNESDPRMASGFFFDKCTALTCAQGIVSALGAREAGAGGQHIKVSMLEAALQMLWPDAYYNHTWASSAGAPLDPAKPIMEQIEASESEEVKKMAIRAAEDTLLDPEFTKCLEKVKHFMFGTHWAARPPFTFSATPVTGRPAAPMMGQHSTHILKHLVHRQRD